MEKWKAKNASHFPHPRLRRASVISELNGEIAPLRYTNNLTGTKDRAGHTFREFYSRAEQSSSLLPPLRSIFARLKEDEYG
jgi:hypothetical protein